MSRLKVTNLRAPYLDVIVSVVVQIQHSVEFGIAPHVKIVSILHTFGYGLSCVLLHLNIVELSANIEWWRKKNSQANEFDGYYMFSWKIRSGLKHLKRKAAV